MRVHLSALWKLAIVFLIANLTLCAGVITIVNPSFELASAGTPLTGSIYSYDTSNPPYGWSITQGNLESVRAGGGWVAEDGSYSIDMNGVGAGNTILTQTISGFTPGSTYTLTFGLSANTGWCTPASPCSLQVSISGTTQNYDNVGQNTMVFADQSFQFTPSDALATLSFTDTTNRGGSGGPAIDDVRITGPSGGLTIPEPASSLLLLGGLSILAALAGRPR